MIYLSWLMKKLYYMTSTGIPGIQVNGACEAEGIGGGEGEVGRGGGGGGGG